ncbi:DUF3039 domain-containing protein [Actinomyces massiliensis]|uniref:DUF3039 domain-containing protein n=1 Tax=Actinomyces massiliensis TaxID=461393 RepID=UPI0036F1E6C9
MRASVQHPPPPPEAGVGGAGPQLSSPTHTISNPGNHHTWKSVPGEVAHRAHRLHIGDAAVQGTAVRALCGVFFVPRTDPTDLPYCEECSRRYAQLPPF